MSGQQLSHSDLVNLINEIIQGQDMNTLTGKIVRQQVVKRLGPKAPEDSEQLKNSVRNALAEVLRHQQQSPTPKNNSFSPLTGSTKPTKNDDDSENKPQPNDDDNEPKESLSPMKQPPKRLHRNASDDDDENADDESDFNPDTMEIPQEGSSNKKKVKRNSSEDDDKSGSEFDMDDDSDQIQETEKRQKRKAESEKRVSNGVKRRKSSNSKTPSGKVGKQFAKLLQICRALGQPVPPSRLKNKNTVDKCASVVQFLVSKGIDKANPALLTRKEIAQHRARLEKEKELEGLDTKYVFLHVLCITNFFL